MRGLRIFSIKLNFYEDDHHSSAHVAIEWAHDMQSAAQVLKMCGGVEMAPAALLGNDSTDQRALRTVRTFKFENRDDALDAYDKFEEVLRAEQNARKQEADVSKFV